MTAAPATTLRGSLGVTTHPLDQLDLEAGEFTNPRTMTGLAPAEVRELATSIWEHGLFDPLKCRRYLVGEPPVVRLLVEDGQRRTKALRYLAEAGYIVGNIEVPIVLVEVESPAPMDPQASLEAFIEALVMGQQRKPLSSYEQVHAAATLAAGKKKQAEIALILGRSDAWVSRMLAAWKTSTHELRQMFATESITDEQFKELATVKAAEQPAVVKDVVETREKVGKREAREKSKAEAAKNTPAPKKRAATIAKEEAAAKSRPTNRELFQDYTPPVNRLPPRAALGNRDVTSGEILAMAKLLAPVDQYMKGIVDMSRCIAGEIDTSKLAKPFRVWIDRVKKKMASSEKAPVPAAAKPKKGAKPVKAAKAKPKSNAPTTQGGTILPAAGAVSKACRARHHHRCKGDCLCACHGSK